MNVTTLPASRQRGNQQAAPRSGGRTAARAAEHEERDHLIDGATALQPQRETTTPGSTPGKPASPRLRVAPPAPVSAPRAPFVALVLVLVLSGVIGILVLNTRIAENAFRLDALKTKQNGLDRDEQRLRSDLADKESPVTLASRAKQLGLVPSRTPAFLLLPDGTKLEMPGPGK
ncbi:hypothetical protein ACFFX1_48985 [Dactylosporangium sucinum]|uniref:Cell division protein FtsL n=1 Tax=Dactylosporangium sucinum TaxID=1424081 RepID=A0A917X7A4_9ACTN|nr:hypothetical protein [Dactylosporangium sucinum]GGM85291.1 hypothetical protein GCM10007977_103780 [Dactylosporangium sucinum]